MMDIRTGIVYLLISDEGIPVGTVTLTNNEIDRLLVLPSFQHRGYAKIITVEHAIQLLQGDVDV